MSKYVGLRVGAVRETHFVSEYYCGGCGWPVTDHDSFCPECGGALRKSDADDTLQVENDKLRDLVRTLYMCSEFLCGQCKHLHGNSCDFDADTELREMC